MDRDELYSKLLAAMLTRHEGELTDTALDYIAERAWYLTREAWRRLSGHVPA